MKFLKYFFVRLQEFTGIFFTKQNIVSILGYLQTLFWEGKSKKHCEVYEYGIKADALHETYYFLKFSYVAFSLLSFMKLLI